MPPLRAGRCDYGSALMLTSGAFSSVHGEARQSASACAVSSAGKGWVWRAAPATRGGV
ncbi:MAG: hypothetical protein K2I74_09445 [Treponemataceae bacterium]|nr:hypothetical protein [Treponemataceae bacterium]